MGAKKIIIAGIVSGIVILILTFAVDFLIQLVFPFDIFSLGGMRSMDDPIMTLWFAYPFVLGFAMTIAYGIIGKVFSGNWVEKGKMFGLVVWLVAGLPSAFMVYSSMDYPIGFTISSLIGSLITMVAAGLAITKFVE